MEPTREISRGGKEKDKKIETPPPYEKISVVENTHPDETPQTSERLAETRLQLTEATSKQKSVNSENPQSQIISSDTETLEHVAQERLSDYRSQRESYYGQKRKAFFGEPKPETWKTRLASRLKPIRNFTRMGGDLLRSLQSIRERETLPDAQVSATVLSRSEILNDPQFQALLQIDDNKKPLMDLLDRELFREVNCRNILKIEGLSPAQFHLLAKQMGGSPKAFLSDDRGENAGRYSADNILPADGKHPFVAEDDPDYETEKALWGPVFPGLEKVPLIKNWRMSRTHAVIYGVKDSDDKDVLLLPVHVDPKNPVAALRFGRNALKYHQAIGVEQIGKAKYVGTGLYDLGIKYFMKHLKDANNNGLIRSLNLSGEDKLATTSKITRDDEITMNINQLVSQEKQA